FLLFFTAPLPTTGFHSVYPTETHLQISTYTDRGRSPYFIKKGKKEKSGLIQQINKKPRT
ncbi:hypothetical protein WAI89_21565, partial [Acinetobacter baumannii]